MATVVDKPRVRFAPSPTGHLHIGGMRTALFNLLFARHYGGTFLLRIEDTDLERSSTDYFKAQQEALNWVGVSSDEPLVFQSQRTHVYQDILNQLLAHNKVYRCVCSPEEIEARVKAAGITDEFFGYDGFCRNKAIKADSEKPFVIRCALPENLQEIVVQDLILGTVTFDRSQFDDFIIVRSDGSVTYNFAVVIDDAFMKITHVIRGQEHLGNTPKQWILYQACGYQVPKFAHIPLILSPNGGKLSKRDGAVDVLAYKHNGYLSDALVNYCMRLGWAHGDQELFNRQQLIDAFTLEGVGKKSAVFDTAKLNWVNSQYIKQLTAGDCLTWLVADVDTQLLQKLSNWSYDQVLHAVKLYQERVHTGKELVDQLLTVHNGPMEYNADALKAWINPESLGHLDKVVVELQKLSDFTDTAIKVVIKQYCDVHGVKLPVLAQPIRIALTGDIQSPGVFELLALLGRSESFKRIHALQEYKESR